MRAIGAREMCHERLGDRFDSALSDYDTQRRVETLIDRFLPADLAGHSALDVGCGLGFFSQRLHQSGADVTACDLGPSLVERTVQRVGCEGVVADALDLVSRFGTNHFDIVVSSECIEHTPDPGRALQQMVAVLKPGGWIAVSTPNLLWFPVVWAATRLRLRPFDGYENFSTWRSIRRTLTDAEVQITSESGLHLIPFQLPLNRLSRWLDARAQAVRWAMINICIAGRKVSTQDAAPSVTDRPALSARRHVA